jgi:hypothetical protein
LEKRVLGVDCGRVILHQMNGTPVPGAIETLFVIVRNGRFQSIWVVSKCGPKVEAKTIGWLKALDFWQRTGIPEGNIRFCRTYQGKDPICRELGVTDFIDDKPIVLDCLTTVKRRIAFNPKECDLELHSRQGGRRIDRVVRNWPDAMLALAD